MYGELVKSLRICGKIRSADDYCVAFHDGCCEAEPVCMYELMMKAADAIEELSRRCEQFQYMPPPAWIPVAERQPEVRTWVLCYCRANSFDVFRMTDDGNWQYGNRSIYMKGYVTHWMPLPEPPKEE